MKFKKLDKDNLDPKTRAAFDTAFNWIGQVMEDASQAIDQKKELDGGDAAIQWPLTCKASIDDALIPVLSNLIAGAVRPATCSLIKIENKFIKAPSPLDKFFLTMHLLGHQFVSDLGYSFDKEIYGDVGFVEASLIVFAAMATFHYLGIETITPYMLTELAYTISDLVEVEKTNGQRYSSQDQVDFIETLYMHLLLRDKKSIYN